MPSASGRKPLILAAAIAAAVIVIGVVGAVIYFSLHRTPEVEQTQTPAPSTSLASAPMPQPTSTAPAPAVSSPPSVAMAPVPQAPAMASAPQPIASVAAPAPTSVAAASAPSFNCARAATPTEYAICDNPSLAALDGRMGQLYEQRVANDPGERARQISWINARNATCGADVNCLMAAERSRIQALENLTAPVERAAPAAVALIVAPAPAAPVAVNKPIVPSGPTRTQQIAIKLTDKAEIEFGQQNYTAAIANTKAALAIWPDYRRARLLLGRAERAQQAAMNSIKFH